MNYDAELMKKMGIKHEPVPGLPARRRSSRKELAAENRELRRDLKAARCGGLLMLGALFLWAILVAVR